MPRRRRKNCERKPSLIFTESPVNKAHDYTSPVRGANHPQTARVVPVEDLADLTWVSPQFHGPSASGKGRHRGARRRSLSRTFSTTRSRTLQGKENLHCSLGSRRKLPRSFVPLTLEWEKSKEISDIQDVPESDKDPEFNCSCIADFESVNTSSTVTPPADVLERNNQSRRQWRKSNAQSKFESKDVIPRFNLDLSTLDSLSQARGAPNRMTESPQHWGHSTETLPLQGDSRHKVTSLPQSNRLKQKYWEALDLLRSPVRSAESKKCKVLVLDTPETEYGVHRRQRRQPETEYGVHRRQRRQLNT